MPDSVNGMIVSFKDAIESIVNSQKDVLQLVTKWRELFNNDTPAYVRFDFSDGTHNDVPNVAMIISEISETSEETFTAQEFVAQTLSNLSSHLTSTQLAVFQALSVGNEMIYGRGQRNSAGYWTNGKFKGNNEYFTMAQFTNHDTNTHNIAFDSIPRYMVLDQDISLSRTCRVKFTPMNKPGADTPKSDIYTDMITTMEVMSGATQHIFYFEDTFSVRGGYKYKVILNPNDVLVLWINNRLEGTEGNETPIVSIIYSEVRNLPGAITRE